MELQKRNFKGFVFTLDAVFALIIAVAGVSILLYAHYESSYPYLSPASESSSLLQSLLQTSMASASGGSVYVKYLLNSWAGNAYTWPQFAHDQYLSSNNSYGPQAAYLLYSFGAANMIVPVVAVDQGIAAFSTGTAIYAINATTGTLISGYPLAGGTIPQAPVIYKNEIVYANSLGYINAVSISNALVQLWSAAPGAAASTPLQLEDGYIVFGSGNNVYLINPTNGTTFASTTLPVSNQAQPPAFAKGDFIISTTSATLQNYGYGYALAGSALSLVWSYPLTASPTTQPTVNGTAVAVGSGSYLYMLTLGNALIRNPLLPTQVVGVAASGSNFYAETSNAIFGFSPSGSTMFSYATSADSQSSVPSVSYPMLYTLINGQTFQGYNLQTGANAWSMMLPSSSAYTGYSNIAIAYGNAYVPNGNTLYVFGTYDAQPGDSLLQSIASMYLSNQGAYSNLLLSRIYNSTNIGIFLNNTYAPSLGIASFNGASSYITFPSSSLQPPASVFVWVYPTGLAGTQWLYHEGTTGTWAQIGVYINGNGEGMECPSSDYPGTMALVPNAWNFVGVVIQSPTSAALYVNGNIQPLPISCTFTPGTYPSVFGYNPTGAQYLAGSGADLQVYSTALAPSQVMQLYQAGQFGVPTNTMNLAGWWPLDGNANDYSKYYDFGIPSGVAYMSVNALPASLKNAFEVSKATMPLSLVSNGVSRLYNVSVVSWR